MKDNEEGCGWRVCVVQGPDMKVFYVALWLALILIPCFWLDLPQQSSASNRCTLDRDAEAPAARAMVARPQAPDRRAAL